MILIVLYGVIQFLIYHYVYVILHIKYFEVKTCFKYQFKRPFLLQI